MDNQIPQLTLTPDLEEPKAEVKQETEMAKPAPEAGPDMSMLSAEEQQAVKAFADQIDIGNSQQVLTYGAAAQKNIADFSTALRRRKILQIFPKALWSPSGPRTWARSVI